jgi:hypothetical protein
MLQNLDLILAVVIKSLFAKLPLMFFLDNEIVVKKVLLERFLFLQLLRWQLAILLTEYVLLIIPIGREALLLAHVFSSSPIFFQGLLSLASTSIIFHQFFSLLLSAFYQLVFLLVLPSTLLLCLHEIFLNLVLHILRIDSLLLFNTFLGRCLEVRLLQSLDFFNLLLFSTERKCLSCLTSFFKLFPNLGFLLWLSTFKKVILRGLLNHLHNTQRRFRIVCCLYFPAGLSFHWSSFL